MSCKNTLSTSTFYTFTAPVKLPASQRADYKWCHVINAMFFPLCVVLSWEVSRFIFLHQYFATFYPRGASSARVIAIIVCLSVCVSVCLSVCLCVTRRYCIKTAKHRITQTTSRDSPGTLFFWRQNSFVDDPHFPMTFALKVTHFPFKQRNFDQYWLIAPQP